MSPGDARKRSETNTRIRVTDTSNSGDTTNSTVLVAETSTRRRRSRRSIFGWGLIVFLGIALALALIVPLPYYSFKPGSVRDSLERVSVGGDQPAFVPAEGAIGFVTVSQTADINAIDWIDAAFDEAVEIKHEDEVEGDQTQEEKREQDRQRMQLSKNSAVVVALNRLGYELIVTPLGVAIEGVIECGGADGKLRTGDLLIGLDGVDIRTTEELGEQLAGRGIGDEIELLVERLDQNNPTQSAETELVGVTLGSADDECLSPEIRAEEPRAFIGVNIRQHVTEDLPFDVSIRTDRVGGSSAGLAFTLAILDVLTEGELTNGLNIVATGTISRDGTVGAIGGVPQKVEAIERTDADLFLVPLCCDNWVDPVTGRPILLPSNWRLAARSADDLAVVGVRTLDDALRAIGLAGGNVDRFFSTDDSAEVAVESEVEPNAESGEETAPGDDSGAGETDVEDGETGVRGQRVEG